MECLSPEMVILGHDGIKLLRIGLCEIGKNILIFNNEVYVRTFFSANRQKRFFFFNNPMRNNRL